MTAEPASAPEVGAHDAKPPRETKPWAMAESWIAWLIATIAPALTFDSSLTLDSDMGLKFQAFFQILCTALFIILWVRLRRFPLALLVTLAVAAICFFIGYTVLREAWTCQYFDEGRVITGGKLLPNAYRHLATEGTLDALCEERMSPFGGQGQLMWPFRDLVTRFLSLFGLYAVAWLTLALLIVGALQERRKRKGR